MSFDTMRAARSIDRAWADGVVGVLHDYITIPNVSPAFDPRWHANGHMHRATALLADWCRSRPIDGLRVEVVESADRTPVILCEIPASRAELADDTVLLYGHLDKQPEMTGWRDGLGPWKPVLDGDRLYGRGGADDGYAVFAALTAIEALHEQGADHARLLVLIEASEESGSPDLPAHLIELGDRLGAVSLVVGLDSGAADYDRLWVTTSLRGVLMARLRVEVLTEGVHSGSAGGVVPSSFRLLRRLLDRIEDPDTGRVLVEDCWAPVPDERSTEIAATADVLAANLSFPWAGSTTHHHASAEDLVRARTWEPSIANVGIDGLPPGSRAGNVLRPFTELLLSCRLAPTADPEAAGAALRAVLTEDPPQGATVRCDIVGAEGGWNAPPTAAWLSSAVDESSRSLFGAPAARMGEGGTIPFMGMLGARFPDAQFLITGVLGPGSNAHGPNEFLHLPTARRLSAGVARTIHAHAHR